MPFSEPRSQDQFTLLSDAYLADETELTAQLAETLRSSPKVQAERQALATDLTHGLLDDANKLSAVDAFLSEYELSSDEGVILMRLAESLVRTPDAYTASYLLRDKIAAGMWDRHASANHLIVKLGTMGLSLAKGWVRMSGGARASHLVARLGDRVMLSAVRRAIALLGRHFVLGTSISRATRRARSLSDYGATFSFDMLGEAAMTEADADRYFSAYKSALEHLADISPSDQGLHQSPALSVKLSALHPRYEYAQRDRCVPVLTARILKLCEIAKAANLGLTIDAEEVDRLEVSLLVIDGVMRSDTVRRWNGFGIAVQAYQKRAMQMIDHMLDAAKCNQQRITIRLVKGAYWDSEIKRAQELGLESYPVFTRKEHTDISYLACARALLDAGEWIYPQFATHNAQTAAVVMHMAGARRDLEFQRLHGMSNGLHRRLAEDHGFAHRSYAPVGHHKELLPYLVRRLLENGANSSFVNQVLDADGKIEGLIRDPIEIASHHGFSPHPVLKTPRDRVGETRATAAGIDLTQSSNARAIEEIPKPSLSLQQATQKTVETAIQICLKSDWPHTSARERAAVLRQAAQFLERDRHDLMVLCVHEAGKTWPDAEAEVREAIDFLLYYADQAACGSIASRPPLGPVACISPWNFPLAIFLGQASAALSVGNTVLAKPAEQTPVIAVEAVKRLHEAGIPKHALQVVIGDGAAGAQLVAHGKIRAVCFTGSTETAKRIAISLAETGRDDIPLIAETGGINAMLIDSTALLEQAVRDVIASAFQSAGQRCSACRLVCVQDDIADAFIQMLSGAMKTLRTDNPAKLSTDLGPIIDAPAKLRIDTHVSRLRQTYKIIGEAPAPASSDGAYVAPVAFELDAIEDLSEEIFGPVLHVVRFKREDFSGTIEQINALGYGLTMGLHSRIDTRVENTETLARVGNLYVNRNQIGAVVGEQPFGGEGLSGTGPKAGGPHYLKRLTQAPNQTDRTPIHSRIELRGPTGEQNSLRLVPRGRLLCVGGDNAGDLEAQIQRARDSGNEPVVLKREPLSEALMDSTLSGVVADGGVRSEIPLLLARRPGPLLPLLSLNDEIERFMLERVTTIDTGRGSKPPAGECPDQSPIRFEAARDAVGVAVGDLLDRAAGC
ncbi:MAG: L-glutamate gamma-semialdehyde dehydrogenase, partial [Pseudomonadota bacterium]